LRLRVVRTGRRARLFRHFSTAFRRENWLLRQRAARYYLRQQTHQPPRWHRGNLAGSSLSEEVALFSPARRLPSKPCRQPVERNKHFAGFLTLKTSSGFGKKLGCRDWVKHTRALLRTPAIDIAHADRAIRRIIR